MGGWLVVRVHSCLDDDELNYLGAPFEEYERNAKLVGLDVLRFVSSLSRAYYWPFLTPV